MEKDMNLNLSLEQTDGSFLIKTETAYGLMLNLQETVNKYFPEYKYITPSKYDLSRYFVYNDVNHINLLKLEGNDPNFEKLSIDVYDDVSKDSEKRVHEIFVSGFDWSKEEINKLNTMLEKEFDNFRLAVNKDTMRFDRNAYIVVQQLHAKDKDYKETEEIIIPKKYAEFVSIVKSSYTEEKSSVLQLKNNDTLHQEFEGVIGYNKNDNGDIVVRFSKNGDFRYEHEYVLPMRKDTVNRINEWEREVDRLLAKGMNTADLSPAVSQSWGKNKQVRR